MEWREEKQKTTGVFNIRNTFKNGSRGNGKVQKTINMGIFFFLLVVLHGLIHLLGFIKGFHLAEIKALTQVFPKSIAVLWLLTMLLFLCYSILNFIHHPYAWLLGFIAVILSQVLIMRYWHDAKFGSIPNLIIAIVAFVGLGSHLLKNEFTQKIRYNFSHNNTLSTAILTEQDIMHLPKIVQQYLLFTRSVGQAKIKNFRAEFEGGMRGKPTDGYMKFHSVQYNFYEKPARYFFMQATKMGLPASGLHIYENETAKFRVKMLNWVNVVNAKGNKLNQAETVTLFNDMVCIAPATLIDKQINWETINDTTVKAIYKNGTISISAILYFNTNGALTNFISNHRYETDGKVYNNYPWSTPVKDYKMQNGYFLPSHAKLIYHKPEGDFTYGELNYKSVAYNLSYFKD